MNEYDKIVSGFETPKETDIDVDKVTMKPFEKKTEKDFDIERIGVEQPKWYGELFNILVFATLSLVPLGLITLVDAKWDWSKYASWEFWVDYLTVQGVAWYVRIWVSQTRIRNLKYTNPIYITKENNIQDLVDRDYEKPFIDDYATKDDEMRKIRAWERKIKTKLLKITNKYRINNLTSYVKDTLNIKIDSVEPFILESDKKYRFKWRNRLWVEKQAKLNITINDLVHKLSKEWITLNITTQKVKYNRVSKTILISGIAPSIRKGDDADYKTNTTRVFLKRTLPSFIFIASFMFLILPLFGSGLSKELTAWLKFITKVIMIASSGIMMWLSAPDMFRETEIKATSERETTLNKYYKSSIGQYN